MYEMGPPTSCKITATQQHNENTTNKHTKNGSFLLKAIKPTTIIKNHQYIKTTILTTSIINNAQ